MKTLLPLLTLLVAAPLARAQSGQNQSDLNDLTNISSTLYLRANTPEAIARMRKDLTAAPEAYVIAMPLPGVLVAANGRRYRVPAVKYNVALRLLEATDSTGSHVWPPGSLDGFYLGQNREARHFRTYAVRLGSTQPDFVEVLTTRPNPPLLLALAHRYLHEDAEIDPTLRTEKRAARSVIGQNIVAGPGTPNSKEPLRELVLTQKNVLKLFGPEAAAVAAYALRQKLGYTDLGQVLQMFDYYNQLVGKP